MYFSSESDSDEVLSEVGILVSSLLTDANNEAYEKKNTDIEKLNDAQRSDKSKLDIKNIELFILLSRAIAYPITRGNDIEYNGGKKGILKNVSLSGHDSKQRSICHVHLDLDMLKGISMRVYRYCEHNVAVEKDEEAEAFFRAVNWYLKSFLLKSASTLILVKGHSAADFILIFLKHLLLCLRGLPYNLKQRRARLLQFTAILFGTGNEPKLPVDVNTEVAYRFGFNEQYINTCDRKEQLNSVSSVGDLKSEGDMIKKNDMKGASNNESAALILPLFGNHNVVVDLRRAELISNGDSDISPIKFFPIKEELYFLAASVFGVDPELFARIKEESRLDSVEEQREILKEELHIRLLHVDMHPIYNSSYFLYNALSFWKKEETKVVEELLHELSTDSALRKNEERVLVLPNFSTGKQGNFLVPPLLPNFTFSLQVSIFGGLGFPEPKNSLKPQKGFSLTVELGGAETNNVFQTDVEPGPTPMWATYMKFGTVAPSCYMHIRVNERSLSSTNSGTPLLLHDIKEFLHKSSFKVSIPLQYGTASVGQTQCVSFNKNDGGGVSPTVRCKADFDKVQGVIAGNVIVYGGPFGRRWRSLYLVLGPAKIGKKSVLKSQSTESDSEKIRTSESGPIMALFQFKSCELSPRMAVDVAPLVVDYQTHEHYSSTAPSPPDPGEITTDYPFSFVLMHYEAPIYFRVDTDSRRQRWVSALRRATQQSLVPVNKITRIDSSLLRASASLSSIKPVVSTGKNIRRDAKAAIMPETLLECVLADHNENYLALLLICMEYEIFECGSTGEIREALVYILDEFSMRYGVRGTFRKMAYLEALASFADRTYISPLIIRVVFEECYDVMKERIVTVKENEVFKGALHRLKQLYLRTLENYKLEFPFASPEGALESTLVMVQDIINALKFLEPTIRGSSVKAIVLASVQASAHDTYLHLVNIARASEDNPVINGDMSAKSTSRRSRDISIDELNLVVESITEELRQDLAYFQTPFYSSGAVDIIAVNTGNYFVFFLNDYETAIRWLLELQPKSAMALFVRVNIIFQEMYSHCYCNRRTEDQCCGFCKKTHCMCANFEKLMRMFSFDWINIFTKPVVAEFLKREAELFSSLENIIVCSESIDNIENTLEHELFSHFKGLLDFSETITESSGQIGGDAVVMVIRCLRSIFLNRLYCKKKIAWRRRGFLGAIESLPPEMILTFATMTKIQSRVTAFFENIDKLESKNQDCNGSDVTTEKCNSTEIENMSTLSQFQYESNIVAKKMNSICSRIVDDMVVALAEGLGSSIESTVAMALDLYSRMTISGILTEEYHLQNFYEHVGKFTDLLNTSLHIARDAITDWEIYLKLEVTLWNTALASVQSAVDQNIKEIGYLSKSKSTSIFHIVKSLFKVFHNALPEPTGPDVLLSRSYLLLNKTLSASMQGRIK